MRKRSKRFQDNEKKVVERQSVPLQDAIELHQSLAGASFDETFELAVRLGIDPKKSDQMVRGAISLPHGIGRENRVIAFARGDRAEEAREAGAVEIGAEELAEKIQKGWLDFDVAVAAPDLMPVVGKLGRILGPQGKMPTPKNGTVTPNVGQAVREFAAGKVTVRADAGGVVHVPVGKRSFPSQKVAENVEALMAFLRQLKPAASKGTYIQGVALTTTMGPGVRVEGI